MISEEEFLDIIEKTTKIPNKELIIKAYRFSQEAHKNQKRDSGLPYFTHPLDVALEVAKYKLDENSIVAGLLHDTVEDTETTMKDINKIFGKEICYLVNGLTKIESARFQSRTEKNAENFRKLILATAKDIRILIIKLIDVLANMRTIDGIQDKERRNRFSTETLMIYVPLAERIGMYKLKLELEDLCFKELFPKEREEILGNIKKTKRNQKNVIDEILKKLTLKICFENRIKCHIAGREKRPYSIWKKMQKKSISFEKLRDIIAFRVIVKNIQDCYRVLGLVNSSYVMVPDSFKDYISKPKINGYQSLHIVVIGPKNVKIEIQIRTEEMNKIAEYGVASHWMYKQEIKEGKEVNDKELKEYNLLKELIQNLQTADYTTENFEDLKYEIYEDEIFCYTPKGDIINLPLGSTGIDFAFAIHKDVGARCCGIKINGVSSQFNTKLQSGDDVEIITANTVQINEDWLDFVKTAKAKSEIKSFIKESRQKEFEKIGREEIKNLAKELNLTVDDEVIKENIKKFNQGKSVPEIYSLIAEGKIKKKEFIKIIFPNFEKDKLNRDILYEKEISKIKINIPKDEIGVEGFDKNIAYKFAKCCYPIPPDEIVGVLNSNNGIIVHKKNCQTLKEIKNNKIIDLEWDSDTNSKYLTKISITMESTPGIFANVINLCAEKKINIISVSTIVESEFYQELELKIQVKDTQELENFKASARNIEGVIDIK